MFRSRDPRTDWLRAMAEHRLRRMSPPPRVGGPMTVALVLVLSVVVMVPVAAVATTLSEQDRKESEEYEAKHAAACPRPNTVWESTATLDFETDLFEVGASRFVVTLERLDLEKGDTMTPLHVSVEDEQGREVSSGPTPELTPGGPLMKDRGVSPKQGRYAVEAAPGSYRVGIDPSPWDKRYAVKVRECSRV